MRYEGCLIKIEEYLQSIGQTLIDAKFTDLQEFIGPILHKRSIRPRSRRLYVTSAKEFYTWAIKHNLITENPALDLQHPLFGIPLPRGTQGSSVERLLMACDLETFIGVRDAAMIMMMVGSGLRAGEICELNESSLVFEYDPVRQIDQLTIRVKGKGEKYRIVPAHQQIWAAIRAYLGHPYLKDVDRVCASGETVLFITTNNHCIPAHEYHGDKRRMENKTIYRILQTYGKRFDIPQHECRPHGLRHRFATELAENNVPMYRIQKLMGHADPRTTEVYIELAQKKMREAIENNGPFRTIRTPFTALAAAMIKSKSSNANISAGSPAHRPRP